MSKGNTEIFKLDDFNFETLLHSINRCYSEEIQDELPKPSDFPNSVFDKKKNIILNSLLAFAEDCESAYTKSVCKRIKGVWNIRKSRIHKQNLDLEDTWKMISESILEIPSKATISSIGSQGFLSIPLYKFDDDMKFFDFIRFHIWENSLLEYIDTDISKRFSIHSHSFLAQSWIIQGCVINDRFDVKVNEKGESSLFKIEYNKTLNKVNQHTSSAVNTGQIVDINHTAKEHFKAGDSYIIKAGEYHKSISNGKENGLSSTFFSFTTQDKKIIQSYVTGPTKMDESEINRKMHIDPKDLISKINSNFK